MEKMRYMLSLFIFALKEEIKIPVNTLFRYVYIYSVSIDYLQDLSNSKEEVIIDKNIGIGDYSILHEALQSLNETRMINMIDAVNIESTESLQEYIQGLLSTERVKHDLNNITYFVGIVSNYSEDVILSIFYNEPNVLYATNRNENVIKLTNNKLYDLLKKFEIIANNECGKDLDRYDVFTTWIDFVFEEYLQGKGIE